MAKESLLTYFKFSYLDWCEYEIKPVDLITARGVSSVKCHVGHLDWLYQSHKECIKLEECGGFFSFKNE
jgi:hypothetical protein